MSYPEDLWFSLLFGLTPVLIVGLRIIHLGIREIASLLAVGVTLLWTAFQLSPWIYLISGQWHDFLLVSYYVPDAVVFSTWCMIAYIVGYSITREGRFVADTKACFDRLVVSIPLGWVLGLSLLGLLGLIVQAGGISELWASSHPRGFGQFARRDLMGSLRQVAIVGILPVNYALATLGSLLIIGAPFGSRRWWAGVAGLTFTLLSGMWSFSRAAGAPLGVLAFLALRSGERRHLVLAFLAAVSAWQLGQISLSARGYYFPGLGNYLEALVGGTPQHNAAHTTGGEIYLRAEMNPLDGSAAWTRKAQTRALDDPDDLEMALRLLLRLNPLPSELIKIEPLGRSLNKVMHTGGLTAITTPALAEIYYGVGAWGATFFLGIGALCGWFDAKADTTKQLVFFIGVLLCSIGFGICALQDFRAMTRPMVYAVFLALVARWLARRQGVERDR